MLQAEAGFQVTAIIFKLNAINVFFNMRKSDIKEDI